MHSHGLAELRVMKFYYEEGEEVSLQWFGETSRFILPVASFFDEANSCLVRAVPLHKNSFRCTPAYGHYPITKIEFVFTDIFKLWSIQVWNQVDCSFIVRFPGQKEMTANSDRAIEQQIISKGISQRDELYDHRLYQPGDDPRFINWNLYARFNELYVRSPELTPPTRATIAICVIVDDDPVLGPMDRIILSYAASIGHYCYAEGCELELVVRSGAEWLITKPESYDDFRSGIAAATPSEGRLQYSSSSSMLILSAAQRPDFFSQIKASKREFVVPDIRINKKILAVHKLAQVFLENKYIEVPDDEKNRAFLINRKRLVLGGDARR